MKHLYFVRHGLSVMNRQGIFSGRTETPLHEDGLLQAHLAGKKAKPLNIDCIVSSPMKRARDTALIIAEEINYPAEQIIINDFFMERAFGVLEGTPYQSEMHMEDIEGVEKIEEILERARQGLAFLESLPHDTILVTSHGAIGRALRHIIDPTIPFAGSEKFHNADVVKLI